MKKTTTTVSKKRATKKVPTSKKRRELMKEVERVIKVRSEDTVSEIDINDAVEQYHKHNKIGRTDIAIKWLTYMLYASILFILFYKYLMYVAVPVV